MNEFSLRQLEIVEFSERVYHEGLRHKSLNGMLYENKLIQFLREDIPEFDFFRGQIKVGTKSSTQFDIIICKKGVEQKEFLKKVDQLTNIVDITNCLGVIELKKWGNPKMIKPRGAIDLAYNRFKNEFPNLIYLFVALRFKDRKTVISQNWDVLSESLKTDGNFCFFGNTHPSDNEATFPWIDNPNLIEKNNSYFGAYESLVEKIKTISNIKL